MIAIGWIIAVSVVIGAVATAILAWQDHRIRSFRERLAYAEAERDRWRQRAAIAEQQLEGPGENPWPAYVPSSGRPWFEPPSDQIIGR